MNNPAQRAYFGDSSSLWTRWYALSIAPRKHLRALPTRTRPNLFGD
jgi:hypothetical protein